MPLPAEVVNFFQSIPANPGGAAIGSSGGQQAGFGITGSFVPQSSGAALITITGTLTNAAAAGGGSARISIGLGPAPVLGATLTGGVGVGTLFTLTSLTGAGGAVIPFAMQAIVTGLTLGLGYWIDMQIAGNNTGTCTPGNITITALEL